MPDSPLSDGAEFDQADPDFDGQDQAEVWDEDNQLTEGQRLAGGDDGFTFEEQPSLYDATSRVGDEDDDEALIGDDLDDSEIVELASDDDDDDLEDDDLKTRSADAYDEEDSEDLDFDDQDPDLDDKVERLSSDEVEQEDGGDLNNADHAFGSAKRFESSRLSDEDITKLGYGQKGADLPPGEAKAFDPEAERSASEQRTHERQDELLDQGVEETFPASDPVSVKHIT